MCIRDRLERAQEVWRENVPKRVSVPWRSLRPQIAKVLRPDAQGAATGGLLTEICLLYTSCYSAVR